MRAIHNKRVPASDVAWKLLLIFCFFLPSLINPGAIFASTSLSLSVESRKLGLGSEQTSVTVIPRQAKLEKTVSYTIKEAEYVPPAAPVVPPTPVYPTLSTNDYKMFIYMHESGNVPCKINGGAINCGYIGSLACGLGQALPCAKLTAVCPLSDYNCQDAWFTNYAYSRYGGWEQSYNFWLQHRWW